MSAGRAELPVWMTQPCEKNVPPARRGGDGGTRFLQRTLRKIDTVFRTDLSGEKYAGRRLLLQEIHPAVKLPVLLGYAALAGFFSGIPALLMAAAVPLVYARLSGIPVREFARRVWAYLPVLLLALSLPGATNRFTRGAELMPLLPGLYFTAGGLAASLRMALRGGVSLSCAMLLLLTTRWPELMEGFAALRLPRLFAAVLSMAYRYLFVLSSVAAQRMEARQIRMVGRLTAKENRRFMGRSAGALFLQAHALSGEITDAMRCRGYDGFSAPAGGRRAAGADWLFAAGNLLVMLLMTVGEKLFR